MNIYRKKILWKLALLVMAIIIGASSLIYTNSLVDKLKLEEHNKVRHWAESIKLVENTDDVDVLNLLSSIIESNNSVPVILTDDKGIILGSNNFDPARSADPAYMQQQLNKLKTSMEPIVISFGDNMKNYIYYKESIILTKLIYYPYIQLIVIVFFVAVAYFAFSISRKAEQNQVWLGMSKETAHQLGTPTSSLAAWLELINERYPDSDIYHELSKDVYRLEKITERFSRIGARPELNDAPVQKSIENSISYLKSRSSSKIEFISDYSADPDLMIPLNPSLFEWVLENIFKNAIDAMNGSGQIKLEMQHNTDNVVIDITDTGTGIPKTQFKTIFKPGFSTKSKGWGLGLSLSQRIIENYHHGKIFVRSSEPGRGTCIRIILRKSAPKN
ncbi:MAG: HAMP domain-containing sensor histidine kinase [Marinilabiliaceae bacterium]|nr:HAMP domain-containing sensor histidine kinase [Marinilabiliaceae bacterium]